MAATDVEICNLALDIVSVTTKITALTDETKEAKACARWYATVRDLVLRRFPWPFAKRVALLTEIDSEVERHPQWVYLYETPADWLKSRRVFLEGQARTPRERIPFDTILNEAATAYMIGADLPDIWLEYTKKFDTNALVPLMPATFVDAVVAKLAARIVKPLSLDAGLIREAEGLYLQAVTEAFGDDADQQQFDPQPDPDWIAERE